MEKPLKKLNEVDKFISELLGADKRAVESAVFIEQGDLKNLLFGDRADREKLFARLTLVSHLEQVSGRIDKEIKKLEASTVNQQPLIDELKFRMHDNQTRRDNWEATLNTTPDVSRELTLLSSFISLRDAVTSAGVSVKETQASLNSRKETLDATLASQGLKGIEDLSKTKEELVSSEGELEGKEKELLAMEPAAEAWESLKELRSQVSTHQSVLKRNEEELAKLPENVVELLSETRRHKQILEDLDLKTIALKEARSVFQDAELKVQIFSKIPDIEALQKDRDHSKEILSEKQQRLNLLKAVSEDHSLSHCPLCESDLSRSPLHVTPEDIDTLQCEVSDLKERVDMKTQEIKDAQKKQLDLEMASQEKLHASRTLEESERAWKEADQAAAAVSRTKEDLAEREKKFEQQAEQYRNLKSWIQSSKESAESAQRELDAAAERVGSLSQSHDPDKYAEVRKEVSDLQKKVSSRRSTLRSVESALESYNTYTDRLEQLRLNKARLAQELKEKTEADDPLVKAVRLRIDACRDEGVDEIQMAYDWYEEKASERKNVIARLQAEKEELERTKKSLGEAEARQDRDSVKLEVCNDLRRLKEAFSRDGIPYRYISHRFFQISIRTSQQKY